MHFSARIRHTHCTTNIDLNIATDLDQAKHCLGWINNATDVTGYELYNADTNELLYTYNKESEEPEMLNTNETVSVETEETTVTCCYCGCALEDDEILHDRDGDPCCEQCFDENCFVCDDCGEVADRDYAHWIDHENVLVCDRCYERNFTVCDRCGNPYRDSSEGGEVTDEYGDTLQYCDHCLEYHTWTCEGCDQTFTDDVEDHDGYCDDCYEDEEQDTGDIDTWRAPRGVRSYSYKPDPCFCPEPDEDTIFYGYELECEGHGADCNSWADTVNEALGYTYVKHDGSLSDGMEIVSHPATLEYHLSKKADYKALFRDMRESGWRSHDDGTCGLHVHISLKAMERKNPSAVHNLLILADRFWDELVRFSRRTERQLDRWAKRYAAKGKPYASIKDMAKRERDRYMAINLENTHTVEIRMFRGTLNVDTFFATLQLVDTLVNRAVAIGSDAARAQTITWSALIESDYAELNAYLKKRDLLQPLGEDAAAEESDLPEDREGHAETFRVGDRVRVVIPEYAPGNYDVGTVVIADGTSYLNIGVSFDGCDCGHDLNGRLSDESGWWVSDHALVHV